MESYSGDVIPGQPNGLGPEPTNTVGDKCDRAPGRSFSPSVFMGSGLAASQRPGMTE
jgi:hypothetical protein